MEEIYKTCSKCDKTKLITEFPRKKDSKDGYNSQCKECINARNKKYRDENKEKVSKARKDYYQKNIDKMREEKRKYYQNHKEEKAEYDRQYRIDNKTKIAEYKKNWEKKQRKENPIYKIKQSLRKRLNECISKVKRGDKHSCDFLGCTYEEYKLYLESKFTEGMSWDNYGQYGWHIDHIRPCDSFDLSDPEEQLKCFHYSNTQPLWWYDNLKKAYTWDNIENNIKNE